jgi:XTP/dITP diphosphohydrolase
MMLHLVFYAKLGGEAGSFGIAVVLKGINEKLINRHPHIYGDVKVSSADDVKDNWEKIKLTEGRDAVLEACLCRCRPW